MTIDMFLDILNLNLVSIAKTYKVPEFVVSDSDVFESGIDNLIFEFETLPTLVKSSLVIQPTPLLATRYYGDNQQCSIAISITSESKLNVVASIEARGVVSESNSKRITVK